MLRFVFKFAILYRIFIWIYEIEWWWKLENSDLHFRRGEIDSVD